MLIAQDRNLREQIPIALKTPEAAWVGLGARFFFGAVAVSIGWGWLSCFGAVPFALPWIL
jgi:hypothetical protein